MVDARDPFFATFLDDLGRTELAGKLRSIRVTAHGDYTVRVHLARRHVAFFRLCPG